MIKSSNLLSMLFMLFVFSIILNLPYANSQEEDFLPVILIHGYKSGPEVWNLWIQKFENEGIVAKAVFFEYDDRCGSSESHAEELVDIINEFKMETGSDKINIVAHSKGGLDARVYLAKDPTNDSVENLIMIGTPNRGSPLAYGSLATNPLTIPPLIFPFMQQFICFPAVYDLIPNSDATRAEKNENTDYYTIAGNWDPSFYFNFFYPPSDENCRQQFWLPFERWASDFILLESDDGIVPLWSAAPQEFENLGITNNCHTNLFEQHEYDLVKQILAN